MGSTGGPTLAHPVVVPVYFPGGTAFAVVSRRGADTARFWFGYAGN